MHWFIMSQKKGFMYLFESMYGKEWKLGKTWNQLEPLLKDRMETLLGKILICYRFILLFKNSQLILFWLD